MGTWSGEFGETLPLQKHDRHGLHGPGAHRFRPIKEVTVILAVARRRGLASQSLIVFPNELNEEPKSLTQRLARINGFQTVTFLKGKDV